jgi:hypothetical protein
MVCQAQVHAPTYEGQRGRPGRDRVDEQITFRVARNEAPVRPADVGGSASSKGVTSQRSSLRDRSIARSREAVPEPAVFKLGRLTFAADRGPSGEFTSTDPSSSFVRPGAPMAECEGVRQGVNPSESRPAWARTSSLFIAVRRESPIG